MKQLLGSFFLWFFFTSLLSADYQWNVTASQSEVYTNEAVELLLECQFSDDGYGYSIELEDIKSSEYEIHLLSQMEREHDGKRRVEYRFVLFAKMSGVLPLNFQAEMKRTTRESIENSVIGRDNVEDLAFISEKVSLPLLNLHVKQASSTLVGDFELEVDVSANTLQAYKPLGITITVRGEGSLDKLKTFELELENAEVFAENPIRQFELTSKGYKGSYTQQFAVVASSDYTIAPFELKFFDLKQKSLQKRVSKSYEIKVTPAYSKEELLDEELSTKESEVSGDSIYMYFIVFIFGLLLGRYSYLLISSGEGSLLSKIYHAVSSLLKRVDDFIWRIQSDEKDLKKSELQHSIRMCKSNKSLLILLIVADSSKYCDVINALELGQVSLKKAKHQAIELV